MNDNRIPHFEGHPVDLTAIKITGAIPMDSLEGVTLGIDDVVTVLAQFRCVNVHHDTDNNGKLKRVQVLRPILMDIVPMNALDPNDDGIIRAMPQIVAGTTSTGVEAGGEE